MSLKHQPHVHNKKPTNLHKTGTQPTLKSQRHQIHICRKMALKQRELPQTLQPLMENHAHHGHTNHATLQVLICRIYG